VILRTATADDLAAISRIESISPQASQWGAASYLNYDCTVAEQNGEVIGFLVCRQTGPDESEILNLAVHPAVRRQGVARSLLRHKLAACAHWFLEVRASNIAAIVLYEMVGFRKVATRPGYYQDPSEPAIVMKIDS
jgi:ribosomal-protein-alanine N-acetyltransferase